MQPAHRQSLRFWPSLLRPLHAILRCDNAPHSAWHRRGPLYVRRVSPQEEQWPSGPGLDSTSPDLKRSNRPSGPGEGGQPATENQPGAALRATPPTTPGPLRAPRQGAGCVVPTFASPEGDLAPPRVKGVDL